jgi:2-phosphosulfolactate phosphatase
MIVDLYLVPGVVDEEKLRDKTLVLIDVLRASTTICQSLAAGARAVIPVEQPGEAAEMRAKLEDKEIVLGGERKGLKIEDFDLGNSPQEYTKEKVGGKVLVLTTSNGTRNYSRGARSNPVITAGMVNVSKVTQRIVAEGKDVVIMCAGNEGDFSIEDTLCGGMIIDKLVNEEKLAPELNDAASLALLLYQSDRDDLAGVIANGKHGRYLKEIGFASDVDLASAPDSIPVLPVLKDRRIVLEN